MVRVALLKGIALALVVLVFASGVVAVDEIMNSTDSAFHDGLNYDRFLGPDSKVDPALQTAIQKFKELETSPSCNKMASSALIYTCATVKDDNEAQESMEDPLREEKILFAARLAVCELSDSADRSLIPGECASFIVTESNTEKKGWFGYVSAKGHEKLIPRYPEYDQATRQDRESCVGALQSSPLTVISYSNAKQTAHQWCSIVRVDIEKDKLLQTYRAMAENLLQHNDILRSHTETLHQQMEATRFLNILLRNMTKDTMDTFEAFREVFFDARETVHTFVQDVGVQLQAKLDQSMAAHEAHDASLKAKVDKIISEIVDVTVQHSADLALARRNDAEEFSGRMSYIAELVEQRMIQLSSNADNASRELAVRGSETLDILQLVKLQLAGANENAYKVVQVIRSMTGEMQQLQDQHEDLSAKLENSGKIAAALESQLLVVSDCISGIGAGFTWVFGRAQATARYYRHFIGAGVFILFLCLGGWPILTLAIASILKLVWIAFNTLKDLVERVLSTAGSSLSSAMSATQQLVDWKGALLLISSVAGIAFYFLAVETPIAYWQRFENGDLSLFEPANIAIIGMVVLGLLCAISSRALAVRESGLLQSGEYESYDDKECAV